MSTQEPAAAPQAPVFRTGVDVVEIVVTVLDRNRRPVRGLTAEDFTVLENGEPRPIVAVDTIEVPTERPADRPAWQDEAIEDVATNASFSGRLVVIMFDRSIAPGWPTERARRIAQEAIDALGPDDLAAVKYNYRLATPVNFTADRQRLHAATLSPVIGTQPYIDEGCCGRCGATDLITRTAEMLQGADRRPKMLLYIGSRVEGLYVTAEDIREDPDCAPANLQAAAEMFDAVQRAQLVIHAIDPEGLRAAPGFAAERRGGLGGLSIQGGIDATLLQLADETGGRTVLNTNTPEARVSRIFQESTVSYLVGFTPADLSGVTDAQRRVTVRVRGAGYTVHAPRSYQPVRPAEALSVAAAERLEAADPTRPVRTITAMTVLSPATDLDLRAAVVAVPNPEAPNRATVATLLGIQNLSAADDGETTLRVQVGAFSASGGTFGTATQMVTLPPRPDASAHAYEVLSHLTLPPGRYEIRATVEQLDTGRVGSIFSSVEIENFSRPSLAVSGLALHSTLAPPPIAAPGAEIWFALPPTTERVFARTGQVTAFLRLLQPRRLTEHGVELTTQIRDARGDVVVTRPARIDPDDFDAQRIADYRVDLPLDQLDPGDYLLSVDVRHDRSHTTRTARFKVR